MGCGSSTQTPEAAQQPVVVKQQQQQQPLVQTSVTDPAAASPQKPATNSVTKTNVTPGDIISNQTSPPKKADENKVNSPGKNQQIPQGTSDSKKNAADNSKQNTARDSKINNNANNSKQGNNSNGSSASPDSNLKKSLVVTNTQSTANPHSGNANSALSKENKNTISPSKVSLRITDTKKTEDMTTSVNSNGIASMTASTNKKQASGVKNSAGGEQTTQTERDEDMASSKKKLKKKKGSVDPKLNELIKIYGFD